MDGTEPDETLFEVKENAKFHSNSEIPKLFINAVPGLILTGEQREEIRKLVEASRKRNVSNRGEKYSLTYGFVLEPRD